MEKNKYFFIIYITLLLLMYSCSTVDYSVKSNPDFGSLASFEVYKEVDGRYKINFDKVNGGFLLLNKDTVFIVLNNDRNKTKIPFFIQDNLLESQDTLLLDSTVAETVIIRRNVGLFSEKICYADIIFTSEIEHSSGYRIWFSFDRGIIQILTKDIVCVEVLTFFPDLKYRIIKKDKNAGYL
ncbi:MAG: hypothetical protein J0G96_08995 [Flavobacteriia bacterium]|mgnify:CR=1 FL=1|nr:hypothetical protein [Flavobacteriia bacterium]